MNRTKLELIQEQTEQSILDSENQKILEEIKSIRREGGMYAKKGNFHTITLRIGKEKVKQLLKCLYPRFTLTEIEKIIEIPDSTLERWFSILGIPFNAFHSSVISVPSNQNKEYFQENENGKVSKIVEVMITPRLAYLIGFTLGDGSVQKYMVEVFNQDRKLKEPLFEILKPYGTITEEERSNGLWRLRLSSVRVANLIKNRKGIRKDTIDFIFNNEELAKQFIAAFWDAEGSVGKRKNTKKYYDVILYNSNFYLLSQIRKFLELKGINISLKYFKETRKKYLIGNRKVIAKKKVYRIRVLKDSLEKWANLIGINMSHSKKKNVASEIINLHGGNQNE